jgi:hypothetical protein
METELHKNIHIFFAIVITIILFFVIFWVSAYQSGNDSVWKANSTKKASPIAITTNSDIVYSIRNSSLDIDFERWFLITVMPTIWRDFSRLTLVTIPTNLVEGSRVSINIIEKNWNIKKLLLSRVKNHKIIFYTKKAGTFQIMKIGF